VYLYLRSFLDIFISCFMHLTFLLLLCNTDASDVCAIKITYLLTYLIHASLGPAESITETAS